MAWWRSWAELGLQGLAAAYEEGRVFWRFAKPRLPVVIRIAAATLIWASIVAFGFELIGALLGWVFLDPTWRSTFSNCPTCVAWFDGVTLLGIGDFVVSMGSAGITLCIVSAVLAYITVDFFFGNSYDPFPNWAVWVLVPLAFAIGFGWLAALFESLWALFGWSLWVIGMVTTPLMPGIDSFPKMAFLSANPADVVLRNPEAQLLHGLALLLPTAVAFCASFLVYDLLSTRISAAGASSGRPDREPLAS